MLHDGHNPARYRLLGPHTLAASAAAARIRPRARRHAAPRGRLPTAAAGRQGTGPCSRCGAPSSSGGRTTGPPRPAARAAQGARRGGGKWDAREGQGGREARAWRRSAPPRASRMSGSLRPQSGPGGRRLLVPRLVPPLDAAHSAPPPTTPAVAALAKRGPRLLPGSPSSPTRLCPCRASHPSPPCFAALARQRRRVRGLRLRVLP